MSLLRKKRKFEELNFSEYLKGVKDGSIQGDFDEENDLGKLRLELFRLSAK